MRNFIDRLTERIQRLTGGRLPSRKDVKALAIVFTAAFALTFLGHRVFRSLVFAALAVIAWMVYYRDRLPESSPKPERIFRAVMAEAERLVRNGQYRDMVFATLKRHVLDTFRDLKTVTGQARPEPEKQEAVIYSTTGNAKNNASNQPGTRQSY